MENDPQIPQTTQPINAFWGVGILVAFGLIVALSSRM